MKLSNKLYFLIEVNLFIINVLVSMNTSSPNRILSHCENRQLEKSPKIKNQTQNLTWAP